MDIDFSRAMGLALDQTRAGNPAEATRTIQAALAARGGSKSVAPAPAPASRTVPPRPDIEDAEIVEERPGHAARQTTRQTARGTAKTAPRQPGPAAPGGTRHRPGAPKIDLSAGMPGMRAPDRPPEIPDGARYETRSHSCRHGARDYRVYVPSSLPEGAQGLVLMLHGCTQTADDFARGTTMNAQAERHGLIVVYPNQSRAENMQGCWNWFRPQDQRAGGGEPALLAELARDVAGEFGLGDGRVFAAGLSAGGAMAAILGAAYPGLFAAIGVHSGLAPGAARDVATALSAMRGERKAPSGSAVTAGRGVRAIVFHGSADATVHPSNAAAVIAAAAPGQTGALVRATGRSEGGRSYSCEARIGADGTSLTELWQVTGAGHAWSGGSSLGSYTDPAGPDASAEMVRFFLGRREDRRR